MTRYLDLKYMENFNFQWNLTAKQFTKINAKKSMNNKLDITD